MLINPPLTDPTTAYHSISYLVGAASGAGYDRFTCIDANVEALNFAARARNVSQLLAAARRIREHSESKERLSRGEELAFRYALKGVGLHADSVARAIEVFRDPDSFYRYRQYRQAALIVKRWLDLLSLRGFPGQFDGFASINMTNVLNFGSISDLTNREYLQRITNPFRGYLTSTLKRRVTEQPWDLIGISVNYVSQLPFAVWLARYIRRQAPDALLCLGGTEITDDVKFAPSRDLLWSLFGSADALVVGEGETALIELLDSIAEARPIKSAFPGIVTNSDRVMTLMPPVRYEDVTALPSPRYDIWDWSGYWSPEPVLLYSPTRGCYWNRCTFCDYGLNSDLPTSPSRERAVNLVVDDLRAATRIGRTVYLAVDAISPRFLRRWSAAIADSNLLIRWSAEIRLEKSLSTGLAAALRSSGCVALSFGYESGSQRILDLIDKGVALERLPSILAELAGAGIGVQMMGFIGFPGETKTEAQMTFDFLRQHRASWTLAGIGDFVLTPGSIVAKRHGEFGVAHVSQYAGEEIARTLYWTDAEGRIRIPGDSRSPEIDRISSELTPFLDDRPFVGGIDSAHSLLYFARFGRTLVESPSDAHELEQTRPSDIVGTVRYRTRLAGIESLTSLQDVKAQHEAARRLGKVVTGSDVQTWLAGSPSRRRRKNRVHRDAELEVFPSGDFLAVSKDEPTSDGFRRLRHLMLQGRGLLP